MTEPMIKGAAIREFLGVFERRYGKDAIRTMAANAPAELRAHLDPDEPIVNLLSSSWYPARLVHMMLDVVASGRSEADFERLAKEATRELVKNAMNSVYRFMFTKLVSPQVYAMMIPRMWRQLHDTGDRSMKIVAPGEAYSRIARWPGHHPILCALANHVMCAIFEEMGCRNVRWTRVSCVSHDGGTECVTKVTWRVQ